MSPITTSPRAPLIVRLISRLPGPFWLWVVVWAALAFLRPAIDWAVLTASSSPTEAQVVLSRIPSVFLLLDVIMVASLIGTRVLWLSSQAVDAALHQLDPERDHDDYSFGGLDGTLGPLLVTAVLTLAAEASSLARFPIIYGVFDLPLLFLSTLPIGGFVWAYGVALVSVDRLGQRTLALEPFPGDRTLGLRPIGSLVFAGFAVLAVGVVLYLLALGRYLGDFLIGAGVLVFGIAVLLLSMWRVHGQMVTAKTKHVERARALYVAAYAPLRDDPSMATLELQSRKLSAAESIERRAESIHEWPVDDRTIGRFAVIATGVFTGIVLRVVLTLIGL